MNPDRHRRIACTKCGGHGRRDVNGWCSNCARRWRRAGRPPGGPPPPTPRGAYVALMWDANRARRRARVEDYADLIAFGLSREEAAARLDVSVRSTYRYDRALTEASTT